MGAPDIAIPSLLACLALLLLPLAGERVVPLRLRGYTTMAACRMIGQLTLVGLFLRYIFAWDRPWLTVAWLLIMVTFAVISVVRSCDLPMRRFLPPLFAALALSLSFVLLYFNWVVIRLDNILMAKYAIAIGGMLLGNSLKGSIIGIQTFYRALREAEPRYIHRIGLGATQFEALTPFIRDAMRAALVPTLASMSTLGIVFLPGMMTGQIIGGSPPMVAIKYQIAIMVAIYTCTFLTVALGLWFTVKTSFTPYGMLDRNATS